MEIKDKIDYLKDNHFVNWSKMRTKVLIELSNSQTMFCCCGKLATSLHENSCKKFNNKVDKETAKRLGGLIKYEKSISKNN